MSDKVVAEEKKDAAWSFQKKVIVAVIGIAVIALAAVLIAKFLFNVDLVTSTSDLAMRIRWR